MPIDFIIEISVCVIYPLVTDHFERKMMILKIGNNKFEVTTETMNGKLIVPVH